MTLDTSFNNIRVSNQLTKGVTVETVFQSTSDLKQMREIKYNQVLKAYREGELSVAPLDIWFLFDDMGFYTDIGNDMWNYDDEKNMLFDAQNINKDGSLIPITEAMFRDDIIGDLKVYSVLDLLDEENSDPTPICVVEHHEFLIAKLELRVRQLEAKIRGGIPESIAPDVMDIVLEHERHLIDD